MLRSGVIDEHPQLGAMPFHEQAPGLVTDAGGGSQIDRELHCGVGAVGMLASRTAAGGEAPPQLAVRDATVRAGIDDSLIHGER